MQKWLNERKDDIFRFWVYKKVYTPHEIETANEFDSCYETEYCSFGTIVEAADLGNGDWLLGFADIGDNSRVDYYRLSEIRLVRYASDSAIRSFVEE